MAKKILIIGGVAGGASAAARLRRLTEQDQIIMFERGEHVSFSNCSLPYYLSDTIASAQKLVLMSPEKFLKQYKIEARVRHEVVAIDREVKSIRVQNLITHEVYQESYDFLIIATGAKPILPPLPGLELANIFTVRNVSDIIKIKQAIQAQMKVAVIGGGFIGVEVAENLREAGCEVSLIEALPQILRTFDYDMVQILHKAMLGHGINLYLNEKVIGFSAKQVLLASGAKVDAQLVIMAIGVTPEVELAKNAGLTLGTTGAIMVNSACQTTDSSIYAIGDAIEVDNAFTQNKFKLSLAWPAQVQARGVANHINQQAFTNPQYIASSCIKLFDYNAAVTGMTEAMLEQAKIDFAVALITPPAKVSLMPNSFPLHFKLLFAKADGRILGAQAIGRGDVTKRIDVIATAIKFAAKVQDLTALELCYAPPFGTAKDVVNLAGYVAMNLLNDDFKQVQVSQVRELVLNNAYILDVREKHELINGMIVNAHHIALSELRLRSNELAKDQAIYIHCRSGQRSYNAVLLLQQLGFKQVYNIAGGFLSLSFYEYFNDTTTKRSAIVTGYNFN